MKGEKEMSLFIGKILDIRKIKKKGIVCDGRGDIERGR